ncbi:hypothetical protein FRC00_011912 [Tulasnella sp. 408]|nr:hypothetical protein FRC00_011912 [Tulasnella sp. 408]
MVMVSLNFLFIPRLRVLIHADADLSSSSLPLSPSLDPAFDPRPPRPTLLPTPTFTSRQQVRPSFSPSQVLPTWTNPLLTISSSFPVPIPPWAKSGLNYTSLPRSLYPILPPPSPYYVRVQPVAMSRASSSTRSDSDTAMTDVQNCEDQDEDVDGTPLDATAFDNYNVVSSYYGNGETQNRTIQSDAGDEDSSLEFEMDYEYEEDTLEIAKATRALSLKQTKTATKAHRAVSKCTRTSRTAKAANNTPTSRLAKTKTTARGGLASDGPAKRTRSSVSSEPKAQAIGYNGVDLSPVTAKGYKTRKTWTPANKSTLRTAIRHWWSDFGAAVYNYPQKVEVPSKNKDEAWMWIWAECKKLNPNFNHNE